MFFFHFSSFQPCKQCQNDLFSYCSTGNVHNFRIDTRQIFLHVRFIPRLLSWNTSLCVCVMINTSLFLVFTFWPLIFSNCSHVFRQMHIQTQVWLNLKFSVSNHPIGQTRSWFNQLIIYFVFQLILWPAVCLIRNVNANTNKAQAHTQKIFPFSFLPIITRKT